MAQKEYVVYYIDLKEVSRGNGGGSNAEKIRFAWRAPIDAYPPEIAKELGITQVKNLATTKGLVFGMNSPRPARVRINVKAKQGSQKSYILFCDPAKISSLILTNKLRGKNFKSGTITGISLPKTSTNPSRSGGDGKNKQGGNRGNRNSRGRNNRGGNRSSNRRSNRNNRGSNRRRR